MKTKKIKIAVIEDGSFYNNILQKQVSDLCASKNSTNLKFEITSLSNVNSLFANNIKGAYQIIVFDNHFKNNQQRVSYNVMDVMDEVKQKNKECFFISISGYREISISAYHFKDNELIFSYSKQSAAKNESHEDKCSIPALHKLMDRYIERIIQELNTALHRIAA